MNKLLFYPTLLFLVCGVAFAGYTIPDVNFTQYANFSLCQGAVFKITPANFTHQNVTPPNQNASICTFNLTNYNATSNLTLQLKLNSTLLNDYKTIGIESFSTIRKWNNSTKRDTDHTNKSLFNTSMVCFDFQTLKVNTTTKEIVGRLKYDFNNVKQKKYYDGSTYNAINITFNNCNQTINYIFMNQSNRTAKNNYFNLTGTELVSILYKSLAVESDNFTFSVIDNNSLQVNATPVTLSSTSWNRVVLNISTTTKLIKEFRVYITKTGANTGTIYFDNLTANNTAAESRLTVKIAFTNNATNSTYLNTSYQNISTTPFNSSQGYWIWVDYNQTKKGQKIILDYAGVLI